MYSAAHQAFGQHYGTFMAWLTQLPHNTRHTLALLWVIFILDRLFPPLVTCLSSSAMPSSVLVVTAPLHHANLLHLVANSWALVLLGKRLEERVGTTGYWIFLMGSTVATSVIFVVAGFMMRIVECVVGFSGVLFAIMAYDSTRHLSVTRMFNYDVPEAYVPWIIFVLSAVLFPGSSWLSHLSGIVVGYLFAMLETMVTRFTPLYPQPPIAMQFSSRYHPEGSFPGVGHTLRGEVSEVHSAV